MDIQATTERSEHSSSSSHSTPPSGGSDPEKEKVDQLYRRLSPMTNRPESRTTSKWPIRWRKGAQPGLDPKQKESVKKARTFPPHRPLVVEHAPVRLLLRNTKPREAQSSSSSPSVTPRKGHPNKGRRNERPTSPPEKTKRAALSSAVQKKHTRRSKAQIAVLGALYDDLLNAGVKGSSIPHATRVYGEKKSSHHTLSFKEFVTGYKQYLVRVRHLNLGGVDLSKFTDDDGKLLLRNLPNLVEINISGCKLSKAPSWLLTLREDGPTKCRIMCGDLDFTSTFIGGLIVEKYDVYDVRAFKEPAWPSDAVLAEIVKGIPETEEF